MAKSRIFQCLLLAVLSLAMGVTANATTLSCTIPGVCTSAATFSYVAISGNPQGELVFQEFDPSIGTLNSVSLQFFPNSNYNGVDPTTIQTAIESSGYVQNTGGSSASDLQIGVEVTYALDQSIGLGADFGVMQFKLLDNVWGDGSGNADSTLAQDQGTYTCSSPYTTCTARSDVAYWPDSAYYSTYHTLGLPYTQTFSSPGTFNDTISTNLGNFVGLSTFGLYVDLSSNLYGALPGSNSENAYTMADASGIVVYDYTSDPPVPEPATMALMGSALLGLGIFLKKRRAR